MKRIFIVLLVCIGACAMHAQNYETEFKEIQRLFQERANSTSTALNKYLDKYPYTPYVDEVGLMKGVLEVEKDKFRPALQIFEKINPKNLSQTSETMFAFYLGYTYLNLDQNDKAIAVLLPLKQQQNPYFLQATYYIGYCYYKQKLYPEALSTFLSLEELGGYNKIAPYYIVQIYYANGNYDEVFKLAQKLLASYPDNDYNAELRRMIGEIYYQRGEYHDAVHYLKSYHQLRKKQRKDIVRNDLYLLGISCYKEKQYEDAINYLKEVKQLQDSIAESTCLHLGHCYLHINDLEKAKLSYAAALEFKINDALREEAMYNYVQVTCLQNSALGENITAVNNFIQEYPNSKYISEVYSLMADAYLNSKNYLKAVDALVKVPNPNNRVKLTLQQLQYQMAVDAFVQGDRDLTLQWCKEVLKDPQTKSIYLTDAYYLKAEALYLQGEYEMVLRTLAEYTSQPNYESSKNKKNAQYLKAYAYFNKKKYETGYVVFTEYLKNLDPSHATYVDALNRKADCCFYLRKFKEAEETYRLVAERADQSYQTEYAMMQQGYVLGVMHKYEQKVKVLEQLVKLYPTSDLVDDAMYEIARAELQLEHHNNAIIWYEKLLKQNRKSGYGPKALLELGMTWRSLKMYDEAIDVFKQTIDKYPNTDEAFAALDGMEQIYVETNNVSEYLAYTKTLTKMSTQAATQEDSLIYVTAELQYMLNNYKQAAAGLATYIARFCKDDNSTGRFCVNALYYAGNSFYKLEQYDEAIEYYIDLANKEGHQYMEQACMRVAELSYDKKDYNTALHYFQKMYDVSSNQQSDQIALLGMLRCSYYINNDATTIKHATEVLKQDKLNNTMFNEALYYRASAYYRTKQYDAAKKDYAKLAQDVRNAWGAEAKYRIAECHYLLGDIDLAEQEIMSFTGMQTTHQYWLAKSLILLADINIDKNDLFQAKQYLLALLNNYRQTDEIQQIVMNKLEQIEDIEAAQTYDTTIND